MPDESLYAPPRASHSSARSERPPTLGHEVDLAAALKYPFETRDGWMTILLLGILSFVPILGFALLFGYCQVVFYRVREGDMRLPTIGELDIGAGFRGIIAFAASYLLPMAPLGVFAVIGLELSQAVGNTAMELAGLGVVMVSYLALIGIGMLFNLIQAELFRHIYRGEWLPLLGLGRSWRAAVEHTTPFLMLVIGGLVAGALNFIGVLTCYIGLLFTMPVGYIISAHLAAQFDLIASEY